jgi:hypothetical protein
VGDSSAQHITMTPKQIYEKAATASAAELNKVEVMLEQRKDWEVLMRVFSLSESDCHRLLRISNRLPADLLSIESMFVNGLLDDSSLAVRLDKVGMIPVLYIGWGNDSLRRVKEEEIMAILDAMDRFRICCEKYKTPDTFRGATSEERRDYLNAHKEITDLLYSCADVTVQQEWSTTLF